MYVYTHILTYIYMDLWTFLGLSLLQKSSHGPCFLSSKKGSRHLEMKLINVKNNCIYSLWIHDVCV